MKKFLIIGSLVFVGLLLAAFIAAYLLLSHGLKSIVESTGPKMTKTTVKLDSASLSPFSGSGRMSGLKIGNPEGFKTPLSISVGDMKASVRLGTIFSDPMIIESILIDAPEITYEMSLHGSNIDRIMKNVDEYSGSEKSTRKYIIKDFLLTNGKINLSAGMLQGHAAPVPVPDLHLTNIGEASSGATMSQVMTQIMGPLQNNLAGVTKNLGGLLEGAGKGGAGKSLEGVKSLFGK